MKNLPSFDRKYAPVSTDEFYKIRDENSLPDGTIIPEASAIAMLLRDANQIARDEGLNEMAAIDISSDDRLHGLRALINISLDNHLAFIEEREIDAIGKIVTAEVNKYCPCGDDVYCYVTNYLAKRF